MDPEYIYLVVDSTSAIPKDSVYGAYTELEQAKNVAYHPYTPLVVLQVQVNGAPGEAVLELSL